MNDRTGQQIGNYKLVKLLGYGGFAEVYLGKHIYLDSFAAIKLLHANLAKDEEESFRLEARTLVKLIHPHIVRLLDFGIEEQGKAPFLVMDYAPNGTMRQRHRSGEILPLPTVIDYVKQIASALQYAHNQRVIHRDVKPENMLLGRNNEILLTDFGIAIVAQSTRTQLTQETVGTISYMAPEQIQAHPRPASDQYSLGVVAYEWLSGQRPFSGNFTELAAKHLFTPPPPLREKNPNISPAVEQVVMTALQKDPKQRFPNIEDFATALQQAAQNGKRITPVPLPLERTELAAQSPQAAPVIAPAQPVTPPPIGQQVHTQLAHPAEHPAAPQVAQPVTPLPINTPPRQIVLPAVEAARQGQPETPTFAPNPVSLPPAPRETTPSRRGVSRRAVLISGLSVAGVALAGGLAYALIPHGTTTNSGNTNTGTNTGTHNTPTSTKTTTTTGPIILAQDNFQRPDQQNGWGTASDGHHQWNIETHNPQEFSIVNHVGLIHRVVTDAEVTALLGSQITNVELLASAAVDNFHNTQIGFALRWNNDNSYYKAYLDGQNLFLIKRLDANNAVTLGFVGSQAQPGTFYSMRFRVIGTSVQVRERQSGSQEPGEWQIEVNDRTFTSGYAGLRSKIAQGVTFSLQQFALTQL